MSDEVILTVQKIQPGMIDGVREHFDFDGGERESLAAELREEGITIESAFVHQRDDGEYFYSYIKASDFDEMVETWRSSEADEAVAYKEFLNEHLVGGWQQLHRERAETIFHIEVPREE